MSKKIEKDKTPLSGGSMASEILESIRKKNKDSKMLIGDSVPDPLVYESGNLALDWLFGCGGIPRGKIIEVYGKPSSGKTTLAYAIASNIQKQGKVVAWEDAEHCFLKDYAVKMGIDLKALLIEEPIYGEEAFDNIKRLVSEPGVGLIVVDSVAALVPKDELEGSKQWGQQASLMSKNLRILTATMTRESPPVLFINQVRDNVDVMYGDKDKTTGGKSLAFYSSVRIKVTHVAKIKKSSTDSTTVGIRASIDSKKNKVSYPFRKIVVDIAFANGIPKLSGLLNLLVDKGIVKKRAGQEYKYKDELFTKRGSKEKKSFQAIMDSYGEAILTEINKDVGKEEE